MQLNLLVLSYVASAVVAVGVAVAAWRRVTRVGALTLALLMAAVAWWLVANAFESAAVDLRAKTWLSVVAYPGIQAVPVLYLLFVLDWTRRTLRLTRPRIGLLLVVPVVSVVMAATNDAHHLLWTDVHLIDAWGVSAVYDHGPWFWVEAAYALGVTAAGLLVLVTALVRYPEVYAARIRLVIAGSLAPVVLSLLYAAGVTADLHADLSSIAFAIAGLIAAWAVLRSHLLDVVPVAWPTLVDAIADAVLVIDPDRRIAVANEAARTLIAARGAAVTTAIDDALRRQATPVEATDGAGDGQLEVRIDDELAVSPAMTVEAAGVANASGAAVPAGVASAIGAAVPAGVAEMAAEPVPAGGAAAAAAATRWFDLRVTAIGDGRGRDAGWLVVLHDVTDRHEMVETIRRLSLTDELTGLLNRRGFTTLAEQELLTASRTGHRLWLLFADLDGLKRINDVLGHEAGDRALCEIADLLRHRAFRSADLVARMGGDEFAVLATEIGPAHAEQFSARIADAVQEANARPGREFALSLSAGVAVFDPAAPQSLDDLIVAADRVMYEEKRRKRSEAR